MDVGCGWGALGIYCARMLGSRVTAVDADPQVFPFLQACARINGVEIETRRAGFSRITQRDLEGVDLLVGADICFWDELVKPVYNLVKRAADAGVGQVIIADQERSTFMEMAERCEDKLGAELMEWRTRGKMRVEGSLMLYECVS